MWHMPMGRCMHANESCHTCGISDRSYVCIFVRENHVCKRDVYVYKRDVHVKETTMIRVRSCGISDISYVNK